LRFGVWDLKLRVEGIEYGLRFRVNDLGERD
jgi:hypothetical protein